MRRLLFFAVFVFSVLGGLVPAHAAVRGAPPGATARCRDGTYSFSQHRSGTCSYHGGVAVWLTGSGSNSSGGSTKVAVGRTVLLGSRTRVGGCTLSALPDRRCSPGAYYSGLTLQVLCSSGFHTSSIRAVSDSMRHTIEAEYGLAPRAYGHTLEIDHVVPLELGGSNDAANLFPEQARPTGGGAGFRAKDRLENAAHSLVCRGTISLTAAQHAIATNWERFYRQIFGALPTG